MHLYPKILDSTSDTGSATIERAADKQASLISFDPAAGSNPTYHSRRYDRETQYANQPSSIRPGGISQHARGRI